MEDFRNYHRWQSGLVAIQQISEGQMGVGSRIGVVHQLLGRRLDPILEVTAFDPGRTFAARVASGPVRFQGTWRYEPVDGGRGTRISGVIEGETGGFFRLAGPLVARAARRHIDADCDTLKELIESRVGGAAADDPIGRPGSVTCAVTIPERSRGRKGPI